MSDKQTYDEAVENLKTILKEKIDKADTVVLRQLMGWGPFISSVSFWPEDGSMPDIIWICPELGVDVNCVVRYQKNETS